MTFFLEINGWRLPVADATAAQEMSAPGKRSRSFRGVMRDARRYVRRGIKLRTTPLEPDDATALESLVNGEGHVIDMFDGFHAATSLLYETAGAPGLRLLPGAENGFRAAGVLRIPAAVSGDVMRWDAQIVGPWTVLLSVLSAPGVWTTYAVRSDGLAYEAGAPGGGFGLLASEGGVGIFPRVTSGEVALVKDTGGILHVDDLVILPWLASPRMLAAWTSTTEKFGPLPLLSLRGDIIGGCVGERVLALGILTASSYVQRPWADGCGWANAGRVLELELWEVDPAFLRVACSLDEAFRVPGGAPIVDVDSWNVDGLYNTTLDGGDDVVEWHNQGTGPDLIAAEGEEPSFRALAGEGAPTGKLHGAPGVGFASTARMSTGPFEAPIGDGFVVAMVLRPSGSSASLQYACDGIDEDARASIVAGAPGGGSGSGSGSDSGEEPSQWRVFQGVLSDPHPTEAALASKYDVVIARMAGPNTVWRVNGVEVDADTGTLLGLAGFTIGGRFDEPSAGLAGEVIRALVWAPEDAPSFEQIECMIAAKYGALPQVIDIVPREETFVFAFTGEDEEVVVPSWATFARAKLWGASGGAGGMWGFGPQVNNQLGAPSGVGGFTRITMNVVGGDALTLRVGEGGAGWNDASRAYPEGGSQISSNGDGLSASGGGGGGGRSEISKNGVMKAVAGGGGGSSGAAISTGLGPKGGNGGGEEGEMGGIPAALTGTGNTESAAKGGTQSAGGAAGTGASSGSSFSGGDAQSPSGAVLPGGGGGDGYFGGGGGRTAFGGGEGGGGGSGFVSADVDVIEGETIRGITLIGDGLGAGVVPETDDEDYIAFAASDDGYPAGEEVASLRPFGGTPPAAVPGNHGLIVLTFRNFPFEAP
jgi:hypothetical protein